MGLEFKIVQADRKQIDRVICDRCDKEIEKTSEGGWNQLGEPHAVYHEPTFRDFFFLDKSWGYDSSKDTETHRAVICELCYNEVFREVKIAVTHYM